MRLALAALLLALAASPARGAEEAPSDAPPALDVPDLPPPEPPEPPEPSDVPEGPETPEVALDRAVRGVPTAQPDPVGLTDVVARSAQEQDEDLRRSRIPFLPSAAAPVRNRTGTHLAAGVLGTLRTRNLSAATGFTQWDTDLEVVPGLTLYAFGHKAQLSVSYVPRLYFPAVWHGGPMSVLQRATAHLDWAPSSTWSFAAWANGTYGDWSQLVPSSTPGGPGPLPPTLDPVRTFSTYLYLALDANAQAAVRLGRDLRLRVTGGWFDVGGLGTAGQAAQPRTWGPRGDVALDVSVGPRALLTTTVAGIDSELVGGSSIRLAAAAETWTQRWSASLETSASLGAALVNNPPAASVTVGHVIPVAGAKVTWIQASRDLLRVIGEVAVGPYVDTYLQAAYQRLSGRVGVEWFFDRSWKIEGSLAAALVPFTVRAPQSYAVAGASLAWTPWRPLTLLGGGFAQTQLQGVTGDRFVQVTGYLTASFQTPDWP